MTVSVLHKSIFIIEENDYIVVPRPLIFTGDEQKVEFSEGSRTTYRIKT